MIGTGEEEEEGYRKDRDKIPTSLSLIQFHFPHNLCDFFKSINYLLRSTIWADHHIISHVLSFYLRCAHAFHGCTAHAKIKGQSFQYVTQGSMVRFQQFLLCASFHPVKRNFWRGFLASSPPLRERVGDLLPAVQGRHVDGGVLVDPEAPFAVTAHDGQQPAAPVGARELRPCPDGCGAGSLWMAWPRRR